MSKGLAFWIVSICLQLITTGHSYAQESILKHYTVNEGLPSSTVYKMLNDSKGYIWICTDVGVSRFDGVNFTNFNTSDGLSDNEMVTVAEDSKGRIWFLAFNGTLSYFQNGKFFNSKNDSLLRKAQITLSYLDFFEDKANRLWFIGPFGYTIFDNGTVRIIASKDSIRGAGIVMDHELKDVSILAPAVSDKRYPYHGLFVYKDGNLTKHPSRYYKIIKTEHCYLPDRSVLFVSDSGIIWQKDTVQRLMLAFGKQLHGNDVDGILYSSDNKVWIGTKNEGALCYDYRDISLKPTKILGNMFVSSIMEDSEHNIWFSTVNNGIYMLPAAFKYVSNHYHNLPKNRSVYAVAKDTLGNIYTGHDQTMIRILKNEKESFLNFKKENHIHRINRLFIRGNNIWIGTDGNIVRVNTKRKTSAFVKGDYPYIRDDGGTITFIRNIKDISAYDKNIVVCDGLYLYGSGLGISDTLKSLKKERGRTYSVHVDKHGVIWYGFLSGLYSLSGKQTINHAIESKYLTGRINDIDETQDSALVLATYGHGLVFYKNGRIIAHLTEKDGLSNNICKRIFIHKDEIFIATPKGATRVIFSKGQVRSVRKFTITDCLLSNNINDVYADDSVICFATSEGLSIFNRDHWPPPQESPPLNISEITCKGKKIDINNVGNFDHNQNSLQINFIGISYKSPDDVNYQYRLGDDQKWTETKNTSIDLANLPANRYHFQVRARISNGPWSPVKSFYFTIIPPFWRSYWFIVFCSFCFISVVILFAWYILRLRRRRDLEKMRAKEQIAALEQQALQAMMNPHFIFNVMNSIQHFINNNEKHEANLYLADFAKLIRMNLDMSSKKYISLDDEIAYLELYISLENVRFENKLTYGFEIDAAVDRDETMLPAMLLQPFIENAIWHGILPKQDNGHIQIHIIKQNDAQLKIRIIDNGIGMPDTQQDAIAGIKTHISKGMKLTRQRLDLVSSLSTRKHELTIQDAFPGEKNRGTKVEFLLPSDLN